jgi:predicted outer membrane protein
VVRATDDELVLGATGARDANMLEAATLATTKASDGAVKSLASAMVRDHRWSLSAGDTLATQLHLTRQLPADSIMARAQVDGMVTLNTTNGAAFDRAFMRFVAKDHQAAIAKLNSSLLVRVRASQVEAFLQQRGPMLAWHLELAEKWLAAHP